MAATHKVMVDKATGKMTSQVYPMDCQRPCPDEWEWVGIQPGTAVYKSYVEIEPLDPIIDLDETYWDFETQKWIEVPADGTVTLEMLKANRNKLLSSSDLVIGSLTDEEEIAAWTTYRQQLRDLFVGVDETTDLLNFVFPLPPTISE